MAVHISLSSLFRVHHGPRRWVFLPHAALLTFPLLAGLLIADDRRMLIPYFVLVPLLLMQIALPTLAGWFVASLGWLMFCLAAVDTEYRKLRMGVAPMGNMWVLLVLVALSLAPLYPLRPGSKRSHSDAGKLGERAGREET
jgi:hypothetical protein